ncbi:hypothetical protein AAZX31_09G171400 [Glycine max]
MLLFLLYSPSFLPHPSLSTPSNSSFFFSLFAPTSTAPSLLPPSLRPLLLPFFLLFFPHLPLLLYPSHLPLPTPSLPNSHDALIWVPWSCEPPIWPWGYRQPLCVHRCVSPQGYCNYFIVMYFFGKIILLCILF